MTEKGKKSPFTVGDREIVIKILIVFTEDIFVVLSTSFIELVAGLRCQDGDEEHVFLQKYNSTDLNLRKFCPTPC